MPELKSAAGRAGALVRGREAERREKGPGSCADPGEARPRRPCVPVRRCGSAPLEGQVLALTSQPPSAFFFFFLLSFLIFLPCLFGMLIKGGGGAKRRGTVLILQSWQLSCGGLCPRRRAGVTPPGLRALPGAQGHVGSAFAGVASQAKGCGVFLGIVIASKTLRARRGGESGRRGRVCLEENNSSN